MKKVSLHISGLAITDADTLRRATDQRGISYAMYLKRLMALHSAVLEMIDSGCDCREGSPCLGLERRLMQIGLGAAPQPFRVKLSPGMGVSCLRCGHLWVTRRADPKRCPDCLSKLWRVPWSKRGRRGLADTTELVGRHGRRRRGEREYQEAIDPGTVDGAMREIGGDGTTARALATSLGISYSSAYVTLRRLEKSGVAQKVVRGGEIRWFSLPS